MGTIYQQGPFRIWINTEDHDPAHVHARNADGECRINIRVANGRSVLMSNDGIRRPDINRLLRIVEDNQEVFLAKWRTYHG